MRRRPQRWAVVAAWGAFLVTVPSAVWRILMILGLLPGTEAVRDYELHNNGTPGQNYAYVFGLSVFQVAFGFLAVGLVRPWGERLLGRRLPRWPVVAVAALGGLAVVYLFDVGVAGSLVSGPLGRELFSRVFGAPRALMVASYLPVFLWGPLELLATLGYALRRRHETSPETAQRGPGEPEPR